MGRISLIFALLASPVWGEDWVPLDTDAIRAALNDQTFVYPAEEKQEFYASGRTLYVTSRPSWGYWEARGDQYCSQWPPSDLWACYDVMALGNVIRFVGETGDTYDATRVDD